ncbi:hypothetical protein Sjap_025075 [Stephania japonica]|uniref:Protein kinase domain-containing protein n=1 Tax=Stephania japonica TaxID=461633 RepID=A0AAP0E0Z2_9MAGN
MTSWRSCFAFFFLLITSQTLFLGETKSLETKFLVKFIRAVDLENLLASRLNASFQDHYCSHGWRGLTCDHQSQAITEIRLENMNLKGVLDVESLCGLSSLRVLDLANNFIEGTIPSSISNCMSLTHLNLSNNLLHGTVPSSLSKMKNLVSLNISNNYFSGSQLDSKNEHNHHFKSFTYMKASSSFQGKVDYNHSINGSTVSTDISSESVPDGILDRGDTFSKSALAFSLLLLAFCVGIILYVVIKSTTKSVVENKKPKALKDSPFVNPTESFKSARMKEKGCSEVVLSIDEPLELKMEDFLAAKAELQGESRCSSLYKVHLENIVVAVKRLKSLKVSIEEFEYTMKQIGNIRHPNILTLVAYHSLGEEKLLIYRYQRNGSLLTLLHDCAEGKRNFPWRVRVSMAKGIADGLGYLHQGSTERESIHHGNLKPSNILLNENEEPLITEFGYQRFLDRKSICLFTSDGYKAPEKQLTEQADVYGFGIILLELLTGKTVERTGIDLPKWVKSMIREEWTGEVFDKEVSKEGMQWAFPLLNIALKCVSIKPEQRPSIFDVSEKIEDVLNAQEDHSLSPCSSYSESEERDGSLLYTVIPEYGETPGSIQNDRYASGRQQYSA